MKNNITITNNLDQKSEYIDTLYEIYKLATKPHPNSRFSSWFLEEFFEIINRSSLSEKVKIKLNDTVQKKYEDLSVTTIMETDSNLYKKMKKDLYIENISNDNFIFNWSSIWLIFSKEDIKQFFNENTDFDILKDMEIGFFIKDSKEKYGFNIFVATNHELLKHEKKEAFFELFTDEKIKKISLFNLDDNLLNNYSTGQIFNWILSDILPHFASCESKEKIQNEIKKYIKYAIFAWNNNSKFLDVLDDVKGFLLYFSRVIEDDRITEEKLIKWIIWSLNYPSRLMKYITDWNIDFEELFKIATYIDEINDKQTEIINETDFKIFNILSSNKLDARYCKIITCKV